MYLYTFHTRFSGSLVQKLFASNSSALISTRIWVPAEKSWAMLIHFDIITSLMSLITFGGMSMGIFQWYFKCYFRHQESNLYLTARHKTSPFGTPNVFRKVWYANLLLKTICSTQSSEAEVYYGSQWCVSQGGVGEKGQRKRARKTTQWEKPTKLKLFQSQSVL